VGGLDHKLFSQVHVMDFSISDDHEHMIHHLIDSLVHNGDHLLDDWSEEGWAIELSMRKLLPIDGKDALSPHHFRIRVVSIQWEAVIHFSFIHILGNPSKTINWETLVIVVGLQNRPDTVNCILILVELVEIMKRLRAALLAIGSCEVNCDTQTNAPPTSKVVNKVGHSLDCD